ncbi:MAG TPA: hypothetical protein VJ765_01475 [Chitinophagaceae bacterium]|nr:hypothetical protein [Chitinophagaceae bacterium]
MISFNNTELIEGVIADRKSGSDGILYSYSKNPKRTVENITENIALVKKITGGTKSSFIKIKSFTNDNEEREWLKQY